MSIPRLKTAFVSIVALILVGDLPRARRVRPATEPVRSPLASFRVFESGGGERFAFQGPGYGATVDASGLSLEGAGIRLRSRGVRLEQGARRVDLPAGRAKHPGFARASIDRGPVLEEYFFENGRVEQVFRVAEPLGSGPLRIVLKIDPEGDAPAPGWNEVRSSGDGLSFRDGSGAERLSYSGCVAIDASGDRIAIDARTESGEIVLEVPADFAGQAAFPLTVDPWIQLGGSASGEGISVDPGDRIELPSLALDPAGNPWVAWQVDNGTLSIRVRRWNGLDWIDVGAPVGVEASSPALVLDSAGNPFVAWWGPGPVPSVRQIFLARWNGSAWVGLGGSDTGGGVSGTAGDSTLHSLAVDASGNPVLAWNCKVGGIGEIYLRRWDGLGWAELGGSATGGGVSATVGTSVGPSLALDAAGNPTIAWEDFTNGNAEIYVRQWDGLAWTELGGSGTGGGVSTTPADSTNPSLRLDGAARPVVAWLEGPPGDQRVFLRQWDGMAWIELGGSATADGAGGVAADARDVSLEILPSGNPILAWSQTTATDRDIFVRYWSGISWAGLGGSDGGLGMSATFGKISDNPRLAVDATGSPVVAWVDGVASTPTDQVGVVYLRRWSGAAWLEVGGSARGGGVSRNAGDSFAPSLALDAGGNPAVAWEDTRNSFPEIYFRRWSGTAWVELAGSATAGGVSATPGESRHPVLALDAAGNPAIAWQEGDPGSREICLRRWTGAVWEELAGSGSGGGVSATAADSSLPSLSIGPAGDPAIAWREGTGASDGEIFFRRWNGSAWEELGGSATAGGLSGTAAESAAPSLKVDAAGTPTIAWSETPGSIYLRRWGGATWDEIGGSATGAGLSAPSTNASSPSLALDAAGAPLVAWQDFALGYSEPFFRRWNGMGWAELGGSASGRGVSGTAGYSLSPVLAVDPLTGFPVLAWAEFNGTEDIFVKRWNGVSWAEIEGSATGGGISANAGSSQAPVLAVDGSGQPAVAWQDKSNGGSTIYLKRLDLNTHLDTLEQVDLSGNLLPVGATASTDRVTLRATVHSPTPGESVTLQFQVELVGTAFGTNPTLTDGTLLLEGAVGEINGIFSPGSYHWRARIVDSFGTPGTWVSFGGNAESVADFVIQDFTPDPTLVPPPNGHSLCGATGLEGLALVGLLLLRRDRRRRP